MDTILETNADVEIVRQASNGVTDGRPPEARVHGICPQCGEVLVSNCYYVGGKGYIVEWRCWAGAQNSSACSYRRIL